MSEFVVKSRKNETDTHDFGLEKLEKPDDGQLFELFESKVGDILSEKTAETLPRLPWQLERLISAACTDDVLPETVMLSSGLVTDLGRYVRAWGCTYLVSDRQEAARRLWEVYGLWKGKVN